MLVSPFPNENGVLAVLTPAVYDHLRPSLKRVRLEAGSTLYDIGSTSDHAWFIKSGIVSLLTTTEAGDFIEAAAVGREGVVGLSGITKRNGMSFCAQVQISGEALRISAKDLQDMLGMRQDEMRAGIAGLEREALDLLSADGIPLSSSTSHTPALLFTQSELAAV